MATKRKYYKRGVLRVKVETYGDDFIRIVKKHGSEALFAAGEVVQKEAVRRAPRRTGKLAGSSYVATVDRSTYKKRRYWRKEKTVKVGEAVVAFTAPHAHLMESGRRRRGVITPRRKKALNIRGQIRAASRYKRMSSRPFVRPALEATQQTMTKEIAGVLRRRLLEKLGV